MSIIPRYVIISFYILILVLLTYLSTLPDSLAFGFSSRTKHWVSLRVIVSKNQRNGGHGQKIDFAHTLSV